MEKEKKATWLELFYDLAFAALVAQLTYAAADYHVTFLDIVNIGLVGYVIFIAWIGTTVNRNLQDSESKIDKLIIQIQVVGALAMSIGLPRVFEGDVTAFFLAFVFIRIIQLFVTYRFNAANPSLAPKTKNVFQGRVIATTLWVVASLMTLPYLYVVAFMALALDILGPQTKGEGNKKIMLNVGHLQERLGLFLILVIGESVLIVSLTNTTVGQTVHHPILVLSGVFSMIALWWAYFNHLEKCGTGKRPKNMLIYLHAHAMLYGSVVLIAAAYKNFLKHDLLLIPDLLLLVAGVFVMGASLTTIRFMLRATNKAMAKAMVGMIIGVPVIGFLGYLTQSVTASVVMITIWIILWVVYDEWERTSFS